MPRKGKVAIPSEFVSDVDEDESVELSPTPPARGKPTAPAVTSGEPDNLNAQAESLPVYTEKASPLFELANLVQVLQNAKASVKGRIDDTGRFELKFGLNRDERHKRKATREGPHSGPLRRSSTDSSQSETSSPRSKTIGWTRPKW
jgi:hypothetical protein